MISSHYSVGFPTGQTISVGGTNHSLELLNWTASGANIENSTANQTGVEFTSSGATVTANVKGNLLSSVSSASGYGNQSSVVEDYQGNLNMVYASGGEIWYTKSTNDGQTWSPEIRISAGDGYARNPSIAQWYYISTGNSGMSTLCVVWVDGYQAALGFSYTVFCRYLDIGTNTWGSIEVVDDPPSGGTGWANSTSKPAASLVINGGYQYLTVAFEGAGTGILIMSQNPYGTWYQSTLTSNTADENPDLFTTDYSSLGGFLMYVTYDDGNNIYMSYATNPAPSTGTPSFGSPYTVNSGVECASNTNGAITVDGAGTVRFTWRGYDPLYAYQYAIWERSLSWAGWNWSTAAEFATTSSLDDPTISGHLNSNYGASIMFHDAVSSNPVYEVYSNNGGSTWNGGIGNLGIQLTTNASYPNLPSTADPSNIPFALTSTNTTPYVAMPGTRNDVNGTGSLYKMSPGAGGLKFSQVIQVKDTVNGFSAAFDLSNIQLSGSGAASVAENLAQLNCDSSGNSAITLSPSLGDAASNTEATLNFDGDLNITNVKGTVSVSLAIVDSASDTPLLSLISEDISGPFRPSVDTAFSVVVPSNLSGTNSKFAVLVNGKPDTTARLTLVDVYFIKDTSNGQGDIPAVASKPLPTEYGLNQNYPNPFNPTTTIEYAIPQASHVTIKVYDALGRTVQTLVDDNESAGYHTVVFDASRFASGVYLYQLVSGGRVFIKELLVLK